MQVWWISEVSSLHFPFFITVTSLTWPNVDADSGNQRLPFMNWRVAVVKIESVTKQLSSQFISTGDSERSAVWISSFCLSCCFSSLPSSKHVKTDLKIDLVSTAEDPSFSKSKSNSRTAPRTQSLKTIFLNSGPRRRMVTAWPSGHFHHLTLLLHSLTISTNPIPPSALPSPHVNTHHQVPQKACFKWRHISNPHFKFWFL